MGTRMAPPYANLFMGKEEGTIILTFLHSIYFWKRFIDYIFFIFLGCHSQLQSLMTFMNIISPTIKYTFTYSEQTVSFLDVQIYVSESRKLKTKLYKKPSDCMALLHFHSHHPLSCKKGIVYSQALRCNTIISDDHILQDKLNNLRRILLARAYPSHLIIKNKESPHPYPQSLVIPTNNTLRNKHSPYHNSPFKHRQIDCSNHPQALAHNFRWCHAFNHLPIQTSICLYKIQQHWQPPCPLYTNIWLISSRFLILQFIYTVIQLHRHTLTLIRLFSSFLRNSSIYWILVMQTTW